MRRPPVGERPRRAYLDWMRGLAVLVMIEAHLMDSWTRFPDRETWQFAWAMILGGLGAPLFLFLAGVSLSLSAGSKFERTGDLHRASGAVVRRGLQIFGLAFLFRLQAWALGWGPWRSLLKVDILNIMGPSIMAAAAVWGTVRTTRRRALVLALVAAAIGVTTPAVRTWDALSVLPDPVEAYIRPIQPLSSFVFFPWSGMVFAGAVLGLAIGEARTREAETRVHAVSFAAGAAIALAAYAGSYLPSPYERSGFWTSSPSFFFLRVGLMIAVVSAAYAWGLRPRAARWSPLRQLGRTSLFIYWIHVEMIYGLISRPLHKGLGFGDAWLALGLFSVFILGCSMLKEHVAEAWSARRTAGAAAGMTGASGGR